MREVPDHPARLHSGTITEGQDTGHQSALLPTDESGGQSRYFSPNKATFAHLTA
jgi:hypothetical protein